MASFKLIRGLQVDNQIILLESLENHNIFSFDIFPYDDIKPFSGSYGMVKKRWTVEDLVRLNDEVHCDWIEPEEEEEFESVDLVGVINREGKEIIAPFNLYVSGPVNDIFIVRPFEIDGLTWIDKNGKRIVNEYYSAIHPFSCNRGLHYDDLNNNYNFIKLEDKKALDKYGYADAAPFTENCAAVLREKDGYWGFIDINNKIIIKHRFKYAKQMMDGLAAVQNDDNLFGYVDINDRLVIDFQYDSAYSFVNGKAVVEKNGKRIVIDKQNNVIQKNDKGCVVVGDDIVCELPESKKIVIEQERTFYYDHDFNEYEHTLNPPIVFEENGKYGLKDDVDKTIIATPEWDFISEFDDGIARAKLGEKWVHIDSEGFPLIHGINRLNRKHFCNDYYGYYQLTDGQFKLIKSNIKYGIRIEYDKYSFDKWFDSEIERNYYIRKNVHHFSEPDDQKVYIRS